MKIKLENVIPSYSLRIIHGVLFRSSIFTMYSFNSIGMLTLSNNICIAPKKIKTILPYLPTDYTAIILCIIYKCSIYRTTYIIVYSVYKGTQ